LCHSYAFGPLFRATRLAPLTTSPRFRRHDVRLGSPTRPRPRLLSHHHRRLCLLLHPPDHLLFGPHPTHTLDILPIRSFRCHASPCGGRQLILDTKCTIVACSRGLRRRLSLTRMSAGLHSSWRYHSRYLQFNTTAFRWTAQVLGSVRDSAV